MSGKAKLCVHCRRPKHEHITRKGEKGRGGERDRARWPLACPKGTNSFKLDNRPPKFGGPRTNNNPPRYPLYAYPLEMVDGNWTRKNRCPVCSRVLPPFFVTAGVKAKQGHIKEADCTNCHSKIGKPEGWKVGEPLDVLYDAPDAMRKVVGPQNEEKVMEK